MNGKKYTLSQRNWSIDSRAYTHFLSYTKWNTPKEILSVRKHQPTKININKCGMKWIKITSNCCCDQTQAHTHSHTHTHWLLSTIIWDKLFDWSTPYHFVYRSINIVNRIDFHTRLQFSASRRIKSIEIWHTTAHTHTPTPHTHSIGQWITAQR